MVKIILVVSCNQPQIKQQQKLVYNEYPTHIHSRQFGVESLVVGGLVSAVLETLILSLDPLETLAVPLQVRFMLDDVLFTLLYLLLISRK